jgi:hypothetical protein
MADHERRIGRPPEFPGETMRPVWTRLPERVHDRLLTMSNQSGQPVHRLVRDAVTRLVATRRETT